MKFSCKENEMFSQEITKVIQEINFFYQETEFVSTEIIISIKK